MSLAQIKDFCIIWAIAQKCFQQDGKRPDLSFGGAFPGKLVCPHTAEHHLGCKQARLIAASWSGW